MNLMKGFEYIVAMISIGSYWFLVAYFLYKFFPNLFKKHEDTSCIIAVGIVMAIYVICGILSLHTLFYFIGIAIAICYCLSKVIIIKKKKLSNKDFSINGLCLADKFSENISNMILGQIKRSDYVKNGNEVDKSRPIYYFDDSCIKVYNGKIYYFSTFKKGISSSRGIVIGVSTLSEVERLYGNANGIRSPLIFGIEEPVIKYYYIYENKYDQGRRFEFGVDKNGLVVYMSISMDEIYLAYDEQ